jgi:hypothetical protein
MIPKPHYWSKVEELVDIVKQSYPERTITKRGIVNFEQYTPQRHTNLEFVQFGLRTIIPAWVFRDNSDNTIIGGDFATAIGNSEMNCVIKKFEEVSSPIKIEKFDASHLLNAVYKLQYEPTDIIIPIGLYLNLYKEFGNYLSYEPGNTFFNKKIRVHFSNKLIPTENIFVSNSNGVHWIQKYSRDIPKFKDQPDYLETVGNDSMIQILAGQYPNKPDDIDFVVRTVAAVDIRKNASLKIELPDDITTTFSE